MFQAVHQTKFCEEVEALATFLANMALLEGTTPFTVAQQYHQDQVVNALDSERYGRPCNQFSN